MYELIRPKLAIPVHGEIVHIHEHAKMAKKWGVPQAICVENGDVIKLAPGKPEKISVVPSGYLAVDGNYLLPTNSPVMKARRKIQHDGVIVVTLIMGHTSNALKTDPIMATPGSLDIKEDHDLIMELINEIRFVIDDKVKDIKKIKIKSEKTSNETLISQVKSIVRRVIKREVGKEPLVEVHVERV
jgi:ribonuclease J